MLPSPGVLGEALRSGHLRLCPWLTRVLVRGGNRPGDGKPFFTSLPFSRSLDIKDSEDKGTSVRHLLVKDGQTLRRTAQT